VNRTRRALLLLLAMTVVLIVISLAALALGPAGITVRQTVDILGAGPAGSADPRFSANQFFIIWNLRLPRILSAIVSGMALAIAGTVFQAVFRNPMADPYVLGISSGAAFGVSLAAFLGLIGGAVGAWQVPLAAGIGALGAALFVFTVSAGMRRSVTTLLLTGIALNFFLSAAMTLFMYLNRNQLQSVIQWSLGSFSSASWLKLRLLALIAIPPVLIIACFTREMDVLLLDEGSALSVGLPLRSMRLTLLALSSIATAAVVSLYGIVGFVGLMVPHVVRLVVGPRHRLVLPCALLGGALMMVASDTISRTVIGASELPVGVVTSIAGAPLFIVMLANYRKGGGLR